MANNSMYTFIGQLNLMEFFQPVMEIPFLILNHIFSGVTANAFVI